MLTETSINTRVSELIDLYQPCFQETFRDSWKVDALAGEILGLYSACCYLARQTSIASSDVSTYALDLREELVLRLKSRKIELDRAWQDLSRNRLKGEILRKDRGKYES